MKKKSTAQSAFFNIRVLIGLFIVLAGAFIALAGLGVFTSFAANAPAKPYRAYNSSVDISLLPPGFDCSKIHELGYDKMEELSSGTYLEGLRRRARERKTHLPPPMQPPSSSNACCHHHPALLVVATQMSFSRTALFPM